jgi:hypothetical protein
MLEHILCTDHGQSTNFQTVEVTRPVHAFYYPLACSFCRQTSHNCEWWYIQLPFHPCPLYISIRMSLEVYFTESLMLRSPKCNIPSGMIMLLEYSSLNIWDMQQ